MWLSSTIFFTSRAGSYGGGRNTHGSIENARRITSSGVCTQIAATVPTITIMNAAEDTSACTPAPFKIAPSTIATAASTRPRMLNTSNRLAIASGTTRPAAP
jgi:hypothetical protein